MHFFAKTLIALLFLLTQQACQNQDHAAMRAEGAKSSERHDDLLFDLKFGMTRDAFFKSCMKLNTQGTITNGPRNMTALFTMPETTAKPIDINFYPDFCQGKICVMKINFNYQSWSIWGRDFHSETLLPEVVKWIETTYKTDLRKMKINKKDHLVAFDGTREIRVWLADEQFVNAYIYDLTATPDAVDTTNAIKPNWEVTK
jgi:hypothetical protein